jgi:hypothetical protein
MNKIILSLMVLLSFSLYAQDEDTVPELNAEGFESTPAVTEEAAEETVPDVTEEAAEETVPAVTEEAAQESVPAVIEEAAPVMVEEETPVVTPATKAPALKIEADVDERKKFNPRESHWISSLSFEYSKYETIPEDYEFSGRSDFENGYQQMGGGRLGFGGEIYLGGGFVTRSMVEAYYLGNLFTKILNGGGEAEDVEFAYTKKTSQLVGGDASQSLGWMFDFKTKNPLVGEWSYMTGELYVEAGIGKAWAYNRTSYNYDTGTAPTAAQESYEITVRDDLLNARIGAGLNLTSRSGFFFSLKATVNRYEITQRKIEGFTQENGQSRTDFNDTDKNAKIDPVIIYAMGGGYKF